MMARRELGDFPIFCRGITEKGSSEKMGSTSKFGFAAIVLALAVSSCGQMSPNLSDTVELSAKKPGSQADLGSLEIQIAHATLYRVLATVADVANIRVTVSGDNLPTTYVREVNPNPLKTNTNGNKGRVTFESLPAGDVEVKVEALNDQNVVIGQKTEPGQVIAGQTNPVFIVVPLDPTVVSNPNGGLAVDLTINDGIEVPEPIPTEPPSDEFPELPAN